MFFLRSKKSKTHLPALTVILLVLTVIPDSHLLKRKLKKGLNLNYKL